MLRRMDGWGAALLRRADWGGATALARRAAAFAGLAGAMFLLCRAQPAAGLAPFGMAFLAAALLAGWSTAALLAGCVLAAIHGGPRDFDLALPVGAAVALGGSLAADVLLPPLKRRVRRWRAQIYGALRRYERWPLLRRARAAIRPAPRRQARSPNRLVLCAALAGAATLAPGLIFAGGDPWRSAQALGASLAAVAAAPFARLAVDVRPNRKYLLQEERLGLLVLACALSAGLATVSIPAALCLCGALSLLLYRCGALAGAALGAALLAATGDARLMAIPALGGAAAQLAGGLSRRAREGASGAAMLVAALFVGVPAAWLAGAGAAALAVMPVPGRWLRAAENWARPPSACDPERLAMRMEEASAQRLRALAGAFGALAEGTLAPCDIPDEAALVARMRARLCAGCAGHAACWSGEDGRAARWLCGLIAQAAEWSAGDMARPLFEAPMPPDAQRRCRRARLVPERVGDLLEDFARQRRAALSRASENRLVSAQFSQARRVLEALAESPPRPDGQASARAAAALERAGFRSETAALDGGAAIVAELERGRWSRESAKRASAALSRAMEGAYAPASVCGRAARFVRRPKLRAQAAAVDVARQDGAPSGDSHLIRLLDGDRLLVLVCDGMGSGEAAARESAAAVRLLGRFLAAGAAVPLAIETVNALLLNRGGEDMFATVDLLLVDLATGEATLAKLAASPTLLLRGGEAQWIEGGRLPLGILEEVRGGAARWRLLPGDTLLMGSDGVMDAAAGAALEDAVRAGGDVRAIARRALRLAETACDGERRDDMTAVCVRIGER